MWHHLLSGTSNIPSSGAYSLGWGCGGVVVSALDFCRSEVQWFEAHSLPLCCFLRQETLPHIVSLHPGV